MSTRALNPVDRLNPRSIGKLFASGTSHKATNGTDGCEQSLSIRSQGRFGSMFDWWAPSTIPFHLPLSLVTSPSGASAQEKQLTEKGDNNNMGESQGVWPPHDTIVQATMIAKWGRLRDHKQSPQRHLSFWIDYRVYVRSKFRQSRSDFLVCGMRLRTCSDKSRDLILWN